jgi:Spy/CpxP family protein refolding chaperone
VATPELDALRSAATDNLPDAEIKARLARVRDVRKQNDEKLAKAQEDLRAVLTVRQEAVAVASGLLP